VHTEEQQSRFALENEIGSSLGVLRIFQTKSPAEEVISALSLAVSDPDIPRDEKQPPLKDIFAAAFDSGRNPTMYPQGGIGRCRWRYRYIFRY
jgi:hypothetical protein